MIWWMVYYCYTHIRDIPNIAEYYCYYGIKKKTHFCVQKRVYIL